MRRSSGTKCRIETRHGKTLPKGEKLDPQNGVEWSLESGDSKQTTPIYVLWCMADGSLDSPTAMGATEEEVLRLRRAARYAVAQTDKGWSCEWCVPWTALGAGRDVGVLGAHRRTHLQRAKRR